MMGKLGDGSAQLANANGSGGAPYKINQNTFTKRLQALYFHWKKYKDELWGSAHFYAVATPPPTEDICYIKSSTFNIWLLGYEFPDTIMVFGSKQIHFLCSQKNASLLESVKGSAKEAVDVDVVIHAKLKDDDGTSKIDVVLHSIRMSKLEADDAPIVGYIVEESPEGSLLEKWADKLKTSGLQLSDVTDGLSDLFAVKDPYELNFAKKAAYLSASAMKNFVLSKLRRLADEEKKVTKSSLKAAVLDPARIKVKLNADNVVDICCPPSFQSGEKFDLISGASRKDDYLFYDSPTVLICAIGSQYSNYCSSVARTFLIDANEFQRKAYKVLLKAHEAALNAVKPGNKVSDVYSAARAVVLMDAPDLEPNLAKMTAGTGIGLVRESGLGINLRNDQVIKAGFLYTISLGFQNMWTETGNPLKSRTFSLLLGDSVFVTDDGCNVITQLNSKDIKDVVYYSFSDTKKEELLEPGGKVVYLLNGNALYSKTTLPSDKQEISKEEELLQQRQHEAAELAQENNEDLIAARRLVVGGDYASAGDTWGAKLKASNELIGSRYNSYCSNVARHFLIDADGAFLRKAYKVLLRAHEAAISAVKSGNKLSAVYSAALAVVQMDASELVPNLTKTAGTRIDCLEFCESSSDLAIDLKNDQLIKAGMVLDISLGFENMLAGTGDPSKCQIFSLVLGDRVSVTSGGLDLITKLSSQDDDVTNVSAYTFDDAEEVVEPMLNPIRLSDLHMYPPFDDTRRNMTGALEAHANGLRYSTSGQDDEWVDIMLANIKHAFFQPAETMYPLLHFHLHNHMMVGNKKTKDLQFFIEVQRGLIYEMDEEQTGRVKRKNMDFQNFVNRVHEGLDLEFEQPQFEQGFRGAPSDRRISAFIVPTKSCLVELTGIPFLVITISEIAIVNLERIRPYIRGQKKQESQQHFDMAIVFKDMKRDVMVIRGIQPTSLEGIKVLMKTYSSAGIKSHKSSLNLNWRAILDAFLDDPQVFEDAGGWDFLNIKNDCDSDYDDSQMFESSSRSDITPASGYEMLVPSTTGNTRRKKRMHAVQKSEERLGCRIMLDGYGWLKIHNA